MTKQAFALYLEEVACELRAFELNREYLEDMTASLKYALEKFYTEASEYCRLKSIT